MSKITEEGKEFKNYPYIRYATDVTLQQANRHFEDLEEGQRYFSGKYKLYGFKLEVSVLSIGLVVGRSEIFLGSVSDADIFHIMCQWHEVGLARIDDSNGIMGVGIGSQEYPDYWTALCDK